MTKAKWIGAATAGALSFALTAVYKARAASKLPTDEGVEVFEAMYEVGELVVTVNPFTDEYVDESDEGIPLYFRIEEIDWDTVDEEFRYRFEGGNVWVSERWIESAPEPIMTKTRLTPDEPHAAAPKPLTPKQAEAAEVSRRKEWAERVDELLDGYNAYRETDPEKANAYYEAYKAEYTKQLATRFIRECGGEPEGGAN